MEDDVTPACVKSHKPHLNFKQTIFRGGNQHHSADICWPSLNCKVCFSACRLVQMNVCQNYKSFGGT